MARLTRDALLLALSLAALTALPLAIGFKEHEFKARVSRRASLVIYQLPRPNCLVILICRSATTPVSAVGTVARATAKSQ
jgi:hypothetical protein